MNQIADAVVAALPTGLFCSLYLLFCRVSIRLNLRDYAGFARRSHVPTARSADLA